ncbi:MAG: NAD(+)/NADH kinase [Anaerolineaceae bacterium]|nr:NAD(+)/NADH kinase [Anaerolineaceae bacterium]
MKKLQKGFKKILLLPNSDMPKALRLADDLHAALARQGLNSYQMPFDFRRESLCPNLKGYDLVIAFGGDGTLIRAGHFSAPLGIPLIGVQAGHLGFLVELNEENWPELLPRLASGEFRLEKRMMLRAELKRQEKITASWDVINDLVIARGVHMRAIEIRVDLQEGYLTSYIADGLIVATATGSTAYAMAAGGPILPPELRNMLLVPIAPHLSLERAVVLAEGAAVILRTSFDKEAVISVDGSEPVPILPGDSVKVFSNPQSLTMVRFGEPNYFYHNLARLRYRNPAVKLGPDE